MLYIFFYIIINTCVYANVGISGTNENSVPNDQGMNHVLGNNNNDLPKNVPAYKFLTADEKLDYLCGKDIIRKIHPRN